jgi:hypothetical protein
MHGDNTVNRDLTITIQDDRYRAAVEEIWQRSSQLELFQTIVPEEVVQMNSLGNPHLEACNSINVAASSTQRWMMK